MAEREGLPQFNNANNLDWLTASVGHFDPVSEISPLANCFCRRPPATAGRFRAPSRSGGDAGCADMTEAAAKAFCGHFNEQQERDT